MACHYWNLWYNTDFELSQGFPYNHSVEIPSTCDPHLHVLRWCMVRWNIPHSLWSRFAFRIFFLHSFEAPWGVINASIQWQLNDYWSMHHMWGSCVYFSHVSHRWGPRFGVKSRNATVSQDIPSSILYNLSDQRKTYQNLRSNLKQTCKTL